MSNRDLAMGLYRELEETMQKLPDLINNAPDDDGPVLKIVNGGLHEAIAGLAKAIAALKTRV